MSIVTITAKQNSKRFEVIGSIDEYSNKIEESGKTSVIPVGTYNKERFPRSVQIKRPYWKDSLRRWHIDGFDENSEDLNALVKACKFKYDDDHPKKGQYIETCDIWDIADPFFNAKNLNSRFNEGETMLRTENAKDKVMVAGLKMHNEFQSGSLENSVFSARTRYVIHDKNVDAVIKKDRRVQTAMAIKLYDSLSDSKKIDVAYSLRLITSKDSPIDLVEDLLYDWATDNKTLVTGLTITKQEQFIKYATMEDSDFYAKAIIAEAQNVGILAKDYNTKAFKLFGDEIGYTEDEVFAFFTNVENQNMLMRVKSALAQMKK